MLTISETVGKTEKHTDVSLWYVLEGDSKIEFNFDASEFNSVKWFKFKELPLERLGINLGRFISKVNLIL